MHGKATVGLSGDTPGPELEGRYANHFQVGCNANEFLIDFGQDFGGMPPHLHTRIIMNSRHIESFLQLIRETADNWRESAEYEAQE